MLTLLTAVLGFSERAHCHDRPAMLAGKWIDTGRVDVTGRPIERVYTFFRDGVFQIDQFYPLIGITQEDVQQMGLLRAKDRSGWISNRKGRWIQKDGYIAADVDNSGFTIIKAETGPGVEKFSLTMATGRYENGSPVYAPLKTLNAEFRIIDEAADSDAPDSPIEKQERRPARIDRKGFVEEPIANEDYRAQVEAELKAAEKQWEKDERTKQDEFERIHKQKLEEWRTNLRSNKASYDDHPDVLMMKKLTGQEGTLIAPSVAKEYDNLLMDRGWYPYAKPGDRKHHRSSRERHDSILPLDATGTHPDVPKEVKMPAYNSVRDHFLRRTK